jgi:hypothetical protein
MNLNELQLHQQPPEHIINELQRASEAMAAAELEAGKKEAALKAWEAGTAVAYRESGMSMAEAERRVKGAQDSNWGSMYREVVVANVTAAKAKRDWQVAMVAADLWRSEAATHRRV